MIMTILESEDFQQVVNNKITDVAQNAVDNYEKHIDFYIDSMKDIDDQKLTKIRKSINIPPSSTCMVEISRMRGEIKELVSTITRSEQTFSNFLSQQDNIKQEYDKIENELSTDQEETGEETEGSEGESSGVISAVDGPNTKSYIVSPDILSKKRGEDK